MKQYLPIVLALAFLGCAKTQHAVVPKSPPATTRDCDQLYQHNLALVIINQLDPDHTYDRFENQAAIELTDLSLQESGAKDRFYLYCLRQMSKEQVLCGISSTSFEQTQLLCMSK
jgi:hypothetical protein